MGIDEAALDTFPKLLLHNAQHRGERPAFREKNRGIWRTTTWRELADEAAALAAALTTRGLRRGDHVALIGDNRPRLYAVMAATHLAGAVAVPLYQDAAAEELAPWIQSTGVTHVFAENQEQVDKLLKLLPQCPALRSIVYDKDRGMRHYAQPELVSYDTLLQEGRASGQKFSPEAEAARGSSEDPAFVFFTSGTTGPAKGAVFTHAALIDRARVIAKLESLTDSDVAMAYLPPGWIGQNLFAYVQPMVVGYSVSCPESSETMLTDMREIGPTYLLTTPRVLDTLLTQVLMRLHDTSRLNQHLYRLAMKVAERIAAQTAAREPVSAVDRVAASVCNLVIYSPLRDVLGMSKVRVAYTAGDAIEPGLLTFFRALGINLKQVYGSTETGFIVAVHRDGGVKSDTVGRMVDGVDVKLSPDREILVRSAGSFKEYQGDPAATAQARHSDGWIRTEDVGQIEGDGELRIVGRKSSIGTLTDGTPFTPKQIENKLKFSLYIKEAAAFVDARDKVCVILDVDGTAVGRWADGQGISYTGHADLVSREEVYKLIGTSIAEVNDALAREVSSSRATIDRFLILPKELSADDGVMTRTGKLRRDVLAERYRPLLSAMLEGRDQAACDLGGEHAATDVKIRNVGPTTQPKAKKAA